MIRTENKHKELYKVFYDVDTEEEQNRIWRELVSKGYNGADVIRATWQGKDRFHREVFIWNR